jgi:hypothetical protein
MPDPIVPDDPKTQEVSNIGVTPTGEISDISRDRKEILNDAFMLGWLLVELKSRIQIALVHKNESGILQSSIWRSIVNKIALMQAKAFPNCTTAATLYEPPSSDALPYLYPPEPDYANIGIPEKDGTGNAILKEFKLYDVTRRAVNCLTLLYVKEQESLVPDVLKQHQQKLVTVILKSAENTGKGGGDTTPEGDVSSSMEVVIDPDKTVGATQSEKDLMTAIDVLTKRTVKFLDAWDGYLRENYYANGNIRQNDSELVAYEAGRAMSLLPWSISVLTVPLIEEEKTAKDDVSERFIFAWKEVFRPQALVRLQHQISSLSSVLDDWYKEKNKIVDEPSDDEVSAMPDANLPSQAIMAVKESLNYWERTVEWVSKIKEDQLRKQGSEGVARWSEPMRLALIEQANIWQNLMTGQQTLNAFNMESITRKLMEDVTVDIQKSLQGDFKGSFKKAEQAMSEIAGEVKDAVTTAGKAAVNGLEEMYRSFKWVFWTVAAVVLVIVVIAVVMLISMKQGALGSGVGLSGLVSAFLGYVGLNNVKKAKAQHEEAINQKSQEATSKVDSRAAQSSAQSAQPGILSHMQGAASETGKMVLDAFDRGYKQIRIELSGMTRSTAVSYPLVEFFGSTFKLNNDDEFLTDIIWNGTTRAEQMKRVMSAAFGSIAIFIMPAEKPEVETSQF